MLAADVSPFGIENERVGEMRGGATRKFELDGGEEVIEGLGGRWTNGNMPRSGRNHFCVGEGGREPAVSGFPSSPMLYASASRCFALFLLKRRQDERILRRITNKSIKNNMG